MIVVQLLIDFGLVVLAWLVQLVVYPGFVHFSKEDMKRWHPIYTRRISVVVAPLMLAQVAVHLYQAYWMPGHMNIWILSLLLLVWVSTFSQAVPLHNRMVGDHDTAAIARQLVKVNLIRTILWSLIFLLSVIQLLRVPV